MKSKIDIVFLIIIFVFLYIPVCHLDKSEISVQENRTLARFEPLIKSGKINFNFTKQFNKAFDDRFFLRKQFISIYSKKYLLTKKSTNNVIIGTDGWLYLGWKKSIQSYTNTGLLTESELNKINEYFKKAYEYCYKNNKKFYVVIAADKSKVYPEYYDKTIKQKGNYSRTDQLVNYMRSHSQTPVLYLGDNLVKCKGKNLLYYKQDTHWNTLGAYYGYLDIANLIDIKHPYEVTRYKTEKTFGELNNMLDDSLKVKTPHKYLLPDTSDIKAVCKVKTIDKIKYANCSNPSKKMNLLMYHDSFNIALRDFMAESFNQSRFIWRYDMTASEFKDADVIIYEFVEREIPTIKKIAQGAI